MRLHRIRLRDFRGVHDREVSLAEHGVTVLQGDNEVGKTSTLVALDLLFDAADSSRRAEIRAAQPAGVDAGPEVEAEVSTGPYRFVYRKRWLRRPRTELHVIAAGPRAAHRCRRPRPRHRDPRRDDGPGAVAGACASSRTASSGRPTSAGRTR